MSYMVSAGPDGSALAFIKTGCLYCHGTTNATVPVNCPGRGENTCSLKLTTSACVQVRLVNFWAPSSLAAELGTVKCHYCGVGAADPHDLSDLECCDHQACTPTKPCRGPI